MVLLVNEITNILEKDLVPLGFEFHAFKIGWYNQQVYKSFQLPYDHDNLAYTVISTPHMFDLAFKQYLRTCELSGVKDPIDECISYYMQKLKKNFPQYEINIFMDHDIHPRRRGQPMVLVQTAGHVSGAAYYYQKSCLSNSQIKDYDKLNGVAVHPKFGGWFALRAVIIFKDVLCPELPQVEPQDVVPSQEKRIELLEKFNFCWRDWSYRDVIPVQARYSEEQKKYFATPPHERLKLISSITDDEDKTSICP